MGRLVAGDQLHRPTGGDVHQSGVKLVIGIAPRGLGQRQIGDAFSLPQRARVENPPARAKLQVSLLRGAQLATLCRVPRNAAAAANTSEIELRLLQRDQGKVGLGHQGMSGPALVNDVRLECKAIAHIVTFQPYTDVARPSVGTVSGCRKVRSRSSNAPVSPCAMSAWAASDR